jgi:hypothetical protein
MNGNIRKNTINIVKYFNAFLDLIKYKNNGNLND